MQLFCLSTFVSLCATNITQFGGKRGGPGVNFCQVMEAQTDYRCCRRCMGGHSPSDFARLGANLRAKTFNKNLRTFYGTSRVSESKNACGWADNIVLFIDSRELGCMFQAALGPTTPRPSSQTVCILLGRQCATEQNSNLLKGAFKHFSSKY